MGYIEHVKKLAEANNRRLPLRYGNSRRGLRLPRIAKPRWIFPIEKWPLSEVPG